MTFKKHLQLLIYSALTWLVFYLLGLPDYYQRLPFVVKFFLIIAVTALYVPMTRYTLKTFWTDGRHVKNARWLALYLTVPLCLYDYLLLGLHQNLGLRFVIPYWYLTFFYFSFWVQFPYIAQRLERQESHKAPPFQDPENTP